MEGDAKVISECSENNEENLSYSGIILAEAYSLASKFHYFKSQHVLRCCIVVADKLAALAENCDSQVWSNEIPDCIREIPCNDVLWLNEFILHKFFKKKKLIKKSYSFIRRVNQLCCSH